MAELLEEITTQLEDIPRRCRALDRAVQPARLNPGELIIAQQRYNELAQLHGEFIDSVGRFIQGLQLNAEENPTSPVNESWATVGKMRSIGKS